MNKEIILLINKFDNFNKIPNNDFYKYGISKYFKDQDINPHGVCDRHNSSYNT